MSVLYKGSPNMNVFISGGTTQNRRRFAFRKPKSGRYSFLHYEIKPMYSFNKCDGPSCPMCNEISYMKGK